MADLPLSKSGKSVQKCPKKKLRALRPVKPSFFWFLMDEPWALIAILFWPNLFFLSDSLWRYSCLWWSETVIQNTFNSSFLFIKPMKYQHFLKVEKVPKKNGEHSVLFFYFFGVKNRWALSAQSYSYLAQCGFSLSTSHISDGRKPSFKLPSTLHSCL